MRTLFGKKLCEWCRPKNKTGYRPPQIDPIGYLIGDVSRMIRTVYDRESTIGTNTGAMARHDETKPHEKLHAD